MVRAPCCEKMGLKRGPWTPEEDQILISYIHKHGHGNWRALPKQAGLLRCGKSCRLRWTNYLRPDIKRGNFTIEEEETIIKLHDKLGNRWSAIAARLPGRTDNEIKNVWHTNLKKKLKDYQPSQITKNHSSKTMPKCDSRVTTTNCTTEDNGNTLVVYTPVSPQESSSEMSSVTDSSAENMNSKGVEVKHEEMNSSEYLPQIDESFWSEEQFSSEMSSSVTDSSAMNTLTNDQLIIKHEEMDSSEYFLKIDESFWSEELQIDDSNTQSDFQGITEESRGLLDYSDIANTMMCDNVCTSKIEEDMDFWFNLFIEAGDIPDLP